MLNVAGVSMMTRCAGGDRVWEMGHVLTKYQSGKQICAIEVLPASSAWSPSLLAPRRPALVVWWCDCARGVRVHLFGRQPG
jgi:hypothetical protein